MTAAVGQGPPYVNDAEEQSLSVSTPRRGRRAV